jgi:hypothetical protein
MESVEQISHDLLNQMTQFFVSTIEPFCTVPEIIEQCILFLNKRHVTPGELNPDQRDQLFGCLTRLLALQAYRGLDSRIKAVLQNIFHPKVSRMIYPENYSSIVEQLLLHSDNEIRAFSLDLFDALAIHLSDLTSILQSRPSFVSYQFFSILLNSSPQWNAIYRMTFSPVIRSNWQKSFLH